MMGLFLYVVGAVWQDLHFDLSLATACHILTTPITKTMTDITKGAYYV
jgi:hypothetical protein